MKGGVKMNNKIMKIQEMLYDEMNKLSDDELMKTYAKREVSRSQALTQSAGAYIKAINTQLKIKELVNNNHKKEQSLLESLGVVENEKKN